MLLRDGTFLEISSIYHVLCFSMWMAIIKKKKKSRREKIPKAWVEFNVHLHFSCLETNITWSFSLQALAQSPQYPCHLELSFFSPVRNSEINQNPAIFLLWIHFLIRSLKYFLHTGFSLHLLSSHKCLQTLIKESNPKDINLLCVLSPTPWLHQDRYQIEPRDTLVEVFVLLQILMRFSSTQCLCSLLMH